MNSESPKKPLVGDIAGVGEVINSEIAKRSYSDALSPAMTEVGGLSADFIKSCRLFLAPIQLAAAYQDRFASFCQRVASKVPIENQKEAPPEIVAPVMKAIATTSDDSPLMSMFEELMAKAIDRTEGDNLSPLFPKLIAEMCPLEAKLIASLAQSDHETKHVATYGVAIRPLEESAEYIEFGGAQQHLMLLETLVGKNLVSEVRVGFDHDDGLPAGHQVKTSLYRLSSFGRWFVAACLPTSS